MGRDADFHVIDDSRYIVEFAVTVLQSEGYDCLGFTSSAEYLERIRNGNLALPRCVITDLSMPEVSGRRLMRELLELQPGQRFIAMTGFTSEPVDSQMVSIYLDKPFHVETLLEAARSVLGISPGKQTASEAVGAATGDSDSPTAGLGAHEQG